VKKTLLFSDIHLKANAADADRRAEFVAFLRRFDPAEYDRIICLGDLFDFWFEYRSVIFSDYFNVLRVFADWVDAGVEVHLVCGNHDFWAGRFLREIGVQVHEGTVDLPFGNQRGHLVHGDGINPTDYRYRAWKRFAKLPFIVGAFRLIHPDWAMGIARAVSHSSRTLFDTRDPYVGPEAKSLRAYAQEVIGRDEADIVLCGHAHAMEIIEYPGPKGTGRYINTGEWIRHRCYTIWDGERFTQFDESK
jgi:UDP-2,3-diacylglucosamine hydrolase